MVSAKSWQLLGEVHARDRPLNSLLAEHLDFNVGTKLPPAITKETTNTIESVIKQRVLDELFDDPVRIETKDKKKSDDYGFDFTKSKKGLGELYEEDVRNKLIKADPNSFLLNDLNSGTDVALKKEIDSLMKGLFYQLDTLSNFNFTPKPVNNETQILTQNVPAMLLEDAIPISVSGGRTKSAHEVFISNRKSLRDKSELTKEEK